jgi:hypothetical protein
MRPWLFAPLLVCLLGPVPTLSAQEADPPLCANGGWSFDADYVLWWLRRAYAPPVLTTSSPASQGLLDRPDTRVVYGDQRLETRHSDQFIGGRFAAAWTAADGSFGLEGRAFFLERDSTYFTIKHRTDVLLALSYVDANTGRQASEIVAGPDPVRGNLAGGFVGYSRIELFGEEANVVLPVVAEECWRLDMLAGARFLQMRDRYHHTATSYVLPERAVLTGVEDNFRIHNAFYGGQVGVRGEGWFGRLLVQFRTSVALGADDQFVKTFGERVFASPGSRVETKSGLFVQPSNSGRFTNCNFDGVGEVAVNVAYELMEGVRATVGYTFLYWADPLRAASQLDRTINTTQPVGPGRPVFPFQGDAFWAQGVSVGLQLRW